MKKFIPHIIALLIFLTISAIYFSPVIGPGAKVLSAHDVDTWKGMSKEVCDHRDDTGEEALWTKRMFSGMPAYQISTKSNGNLLQYIDKALQLGLPRPMNLLFLYLIGFYILLLTLKIDYRLSIVGAIGFAFSSYFLIIIQAGHMTKAHSIAYIPLIVASVLYVFNNKKLMLGAVFTSLFVGLQLYSNHYQITYYTIIILFFIGVVQLVKQFKEKTLTDFFKKSAVLILAGLLGGATNYTRLATTLEYGPETQRGKSELVTDNGEEVKDGLDYTYILRYSYGIAETMTFLIPNFKGGIIGRSVLQDDEGKTNNESSTLKFLRKVRDNNKRNQLQQKTLAYWGDYDPSNNKIGPGSPTYVGAIICFLFVLGILIVKSYYKYWILSSTILSIFLAWGYNFYSFSEFFIDYFPAYNKFRAVTMIMVIAEFGIALLAILGLHRFLMMLEGDNHFKKLKLAFYLTGGLSLVFALFPTLFVDFTSDTDPLENTGFMNALVADRSLIMKSDAWRSFFFILLSATVLYLFIKQKVKKNYVILIIGVLILADMWSVDKRYLNDSHFVKKKRNAFVASKADKIILSNNKDGARVLDLSDRQNGPFNSSRASYFHNSIGGYHAAKLLRYQELISSQLSKMNPSVLSMLNCGWLITQNNQAVQMKTQGVNPLGNAWFVVGTEIVEDANEEMKLLDSFDPKSTAIIDNRFKTYISDFNFDSSATINLIMEDYKPNYLVYNTNNVTSDQLAVFSEIFYSKGWNAYIDGKISPHFRANYVLRAMMVPKGTKKIEFKFEPQTFKLGEVVSLSSSILILLLLSLVTYRELKS